MILVVLEPASEGKVTHMKGKGGWRLDSAKMQQWTVQYISCSQPHLRLDHLRLWREGQRKSGVGRRPQSGRDGGRVTPRACPPWVTLTLWVMKATNTVSSMPTRAWAGFLLWPTTLVAALAVGRLSQVHQLQGSCGTVS